MEPFSTAKLSVKLPATIATAELQCGDADASSMLSGLLTGSSLSATTFLTPSNVNDGRRKREGSSCGIDVDEEQEPESVPTKSKVRYNLNTLNFLLCSYIQIYITASLQRIKLEHV